MTICFISRRGLSRARLAPRLRHHMEAAAPRLRRPLMRASHTRRRPLCLRESRGRCPSASLQLPLIGGLNYVDVEEYDKDTMPMSGYDYDYAMICGRQYAFSASFDDDAPLASAANMRRLDAWRFRLLAIFSMLQRRRMPLFSLWLRTHLWPGYAFATARVTPGQNISAGRRLM